MENQSSSGGFSDISFLENACNVVYGGETTNANYEQYHNNLVEFKDREDAWMYADKLIDNTTSKYSKFFGLQILLNLVKYKWKSLNSDQRQTIKDFICQHTISWSQDPKFNQELVSQIDQILVELIVLEWPQEWDSIVNDLISSATSESTTCQNNLKIFSMLSQQVFDFGSQEMTSTRISQVSAALNEVAPQIFELIEQVLTGTEDPDVIKTALNAFRYIVKWLDSHYIFETQLLEALCNSFLTNQSYQSYVLSIIGEISSKDLPEKYKKVFPQVFDLIISALQQTITEGNIEEFSRTNTETVKSIIFTLSSFLTTYGKTIEESGDFESLGTSLSWIIEFMKITHFEEFKTCCELWKSIIFRFYVERNASTFDFYHEFFPILRRILVARIERPVEILIVEAEDGSYEKEATKNSAHVDHYNTMRECLVLLTNINSDDTTQAILDKLEELHEEWSIDTLNCVCWSAGAITGALQPSDEKKFVIAILKVLLELSANEAASTDDKAMIASGLMFVCSSYPRFLTQNWKFLKAIESKLFEFMQNDFPGVKDMAVDSFTRIGEKCRKQFLFSEAKGEPAFIEYLIAQFDGITSNLSFDLKADMIKAMAIIISGASDEGQKSKLTRDLMDDMNKKWDFQTSQFENDEKCLKNILFILKCNMYVASKVGAAFHAQFSEIFKQIVEMYEACCSTCSEMIDQGGEVMHQSEIFRLCMQIKSTIIQIMIEFTRSTTNTTTIKTTILKNLITEENLLEEYEGSNPFCKTPELLILMKEAVLKVGEQFMSDFLMPIMNQLFKPSVELICENYDSFVEFRIPLTEFMSSLVNNAFRSITEFPIEAITMFENTIEWGCRHPNVDICKGNIELLQNLFTKVENKAPQAFKNQFYGAFYSSAVDTMFEVLTDTIHKYAFVEECKFIHRLFGMQIEQKDVDAIAELLYKRFPNREIQFYSMFVQKLFQLVNSYPEFKELLRDFLVEVRQVSKEDPDFYVEERNELLKINSQINEEIPGMTGPAQINEDEIDFLD